MFEIAWVGMTAAWILLAAVLLSFFLYWFSSYLVGSPFYFSRVVLASTSLLVGMLLIYVLHDFSSSGLEFLKSPGFSSYSLDKNSDHPPAEKETTELKLEAKSDAVSLEYDILNQDKIKTQFSDVAGMMEAKAEVSEVIDFLINPKKFEALGAKIPRGILLYGPPGTGKTLLARAVAGAANVSFISVSGSAFDEQYVGVGAARVRKLFEIARKNKPCILFIDEIDALAPKRGAETQASGQVQTINQLLGEMDNINDAPNKGIIIMGATNRLDFVDEAILRPGRFDRQVYIRLPNLAEREAILKVHLKGVPYAKEVDIKSLSGTTTGFSGADLKNLVNEAAIHAARQNQKVVSKQDFEYAKDKITLGLPVGSAMITELDRKVTAYHEAGHAMVGILLPDYRLKFDKITIGLRDQTLGVTHFAQLEESYLDSRKYLEDSIAMALGGRAAEELVFGKMNVTGGAHNDMQKATKLAQHMVLSLGLSDFNSVIAFDVLTSYPSDKAYQAIEDILEGAHRKASQLLTANRAKLDALAKALLEKETLGYDEVMKILNSH